MRGERVLAVVVLYSAARDGAAEAQTLRCLNVALTAQPELLESYRLLLWDNSQEASQIKLGIPFEYHHAAGNDGVAGAYNGALDICIRQGYKWMLLLDDDTEISATYLAGMLQYRDACDADASVAAIAPLLQDGEFQLSPQRVLPHRAAPVEPGLPRAIDEECFAANSGVMLRAEALAAVGGYSLDFWLDYSDIYVFHQLYAAGRRVYFAADLRLQHSMTMLDYDGRMTVERYRNFLYAEQAFFDLYRSSAQNAVQLLRLFARVFRQRAYRNKAFSGLTLSFLLQRILTSRAKRLRRWSGRKMERQASHRMSGA